MLYDTVELIIQASSNFHFIFCFFNVVIFFLLIAEGFKPRTEYPTSTANSMSFPVDFTPSNLLSINGYDNQERMISYDKQEPTSNPQDDHDRNQVLIDGSVGDEKEATAEEQEKLNVDPTEEGSKEIEIYAASTEEGSKEIKIYAASTEEGSEHIQLDAASTKEGSKKIQIYAVLSSTNTEIKASFEDQEQKPEEDDGDHDVNDDDDDGDELRRKIEEFIGKVNKEWREEELRTSNYSLHE